jgi:23S rRNA pseudouridine2605 synthase
MVKQHPKQDRPGRSRPEQARSQSQDPAVQDPEDGGDSEPEPEDASAGAGGTVRLNKFMAELGVASRRKCDELIASGKVSVDGEPCVELGTKIDPDKHVVDVNGVVLKPLSQRKRYYLLNKPRHVLCTNETREMRTRAIDLITDRNKGRIFTVGRLDEDSSGLIILTNDGDFSNQIAHPRHSVPKTYLVKVRGRIDEEALNKISEGVRLSEGKTGGAALFVERRSTEASVLTVTIREGKNREIRRVFAAMGYKVLRLHRVRIGALSDRRLKDGEWRPLTPEEVADLLDVANDRERSEALFASARQGGFTRQLDEGEEGQRPARPGRTERPARQGSGEAPSRFGGARREWREPKEFRIKDPERAKRRNSARPAAEAGAEGPAEGPAEGTGRRGRGERSGGTRPEFSGGGRGRQERVRSGPGRPGGGGARGAGGRRGGAGGRAGGDDRGRGAGREFGHGPERAPGRVSGRVSGRGSRAAKGGNFGGTAGARANRRGGARGPAGGGGQSRGTQSGRGRR